MRDLQDPVPLLDSQLWDLLADSYRVQGPEAWARGLPRQVTTNPWLARAFARVVHGVLVDVGPGQRVEIIEVGPGPGRFAFLFLQALGALVERSSLPCADYRLTLLELAPKNVAFCLEHPRNAAFIEQGLLRAQVFDAHHDPLPDLGDGLVVCLTTYLLDSLKQQLVRIENRALVEQRMGLRTKAETDAPDDVLQHARLRFDTGPFQGTGVPCWDTLLLEYAQTLNDLTIMLPTGPWRLFQAVADRPGGGLLLYADKGWDRPELFRGTGIAPHAGTLSLMVNFHALHHAVRDGGGWVLDDRRIDPTLQVGLLALGPSQGDLPHTVWAWEQGLASLGPLDAHGVQNCVVPLTLTAEIVLRLLRLCVGDPLTFETYQPPLFRALEDGVDEWLRLGLIDALEQVWHARYHVPGDPELAFPLGACFQRLMQPERALELYAAAEASHGADARLRFNQACCHLMQEHWVRGRELLVECLTLDPNVREARELLQEIP